MYKLRELERKDIPVINKWRNDAVLISKLGATYRYINEEVDSKWYDLYMNSRARSVRCAIIQTTSDDIIGLISLLDIDPLNQSAELHIMIGNAENQLKGAGTFAVRTMLQHAFFNLNLHRVELQVLQDNSIAQHVYEKVGFKREGIKRSATFKNGRFVDLLQYSILREDFYNSQL